MNSPIISGMWKKTANGKDFLSGKTREDITIPAGSFVQIWKNTKQKTDKHPEYILSYTPPEDAIPPSTTPGAIPGTDPIPF